MLKKPEKWEPHPYQKLGIKFLLEHAAGALFWDPGLGKTAVTLAAFKFLKARGLAKKMLVIAPLRPCHRVWPPECQRWTDFSHFRTIVLHGKDKDQLLTQDADIYIINPEGLDWLLGVGGKRGWFDIKRWRKLGFDTLCVDEITKFKNTSSVRFKLIKQVLGTFKRRWGLTGSPVANGLEQLFGQVYVLDEGKALGRFVTHYRAMHFTPVGPMGWKWALKAGHDQIIYQKIANVAQRMSAEDHLKLPPMPHINIDIELPSAARKIYDQLETDLFTRMDSGVITAANTGVAMGKCRQIAGGAIYKEKDILHLIKTSKAREVIEVHEEKLNAVEDLIEELQGQPLFIAYEFKHELARMQKRLGKDIPYIGKSEKDDAKLEAAWNSRELPFLLGNAQSMAHGLNFQYGDCGHVCWYTLTWDFELYDQLNRRFCRQGTKAQAILCYRLIAKETVDEVVAASLGAKDRTQNKFFGALKDYAAERKKSLRIR